jgi:hypothetical protein
MQNELIETTGLFNVQNDINDGDEIFKKPPKEKYFEAFG